jgi:hypothetical protein
MQQFELVSLPLFAVPVGNGLDASSYLKYTLFLVDRPIFQGEEGKLTFTTRHNHVLFKWMEFCS